MSSAWVVTILIIAIILLFVSMVLSAMASRDAEKGNNSAAQKYAMWSAVVAGVSVIMLIIVLILYLYRAEVQTSAQKIFA